MKNSSLGGEVLKCISSSPGALECILTLVSKLVFNTDWPRGCRNKLKVIEILSFSMTPLPHAFEGWRRYCFHRCLSVHTLCYAAGGMPLEFMQNCLVPNASNWLIHPNHHKGPRIPFIQANLWKFTTRLKCLFRIPSPITRIVTKVCMDRIIFQSAKVTSMWRHLPGMVQQLFVFTVRVDQLANRELPLTSKAATVS